MEAHTNAKIKPILAGVFICAQMYKEIVFSNYARPKDLSILV